MSIAETTGRRHEVAGVYNLRDTGGYRAGERTSRWGRLFRSDALHRIDASGRDALAGLRIRHVVDLRGAHELAASPSALDGLGVVTHHLPVFDDASPDAQIALQASLAPLYDHMADERGARLADAIRVIARAEGDDAVLVHCTAGKDRTGLVVAFALAAAGVDRDEVVADYAATADNLRGEWAERMLGQLSARGAELTPGLVEIVSLSPAPVMAALLERVEREDGSVAAYLIRNGLDRADVDRLAERLIEN